MVQPTLKSDPFRIELSDEERGRFGLPLGVPIVIIRRGQRITLMPERDVAETYGILKEIVVDPSNIRDEGNRTL